jgi:hypothetical protein
MARPVTPGSADITFFAVDATMNCSELGTLAIEHWVRKKGEKMRGSQWQDRFMTVQRLPLIRVDGSWNPERQCQPCSHGQ